VAHTQDASGTRDDRGTGSRNGSDKSTGEIVGDLWQLTKDYARQETVDPLKALGRFVAFGVPGALLIGLGTTLVGLGVLRILQNETDSWFDGYLSFVPYLITLVLAIGVAAWAALAITRTRKKESHT